jgi:hypothetical protein
MRCPKLPGLPVQESWSVKMMTVSNNLLEEKKEQREKVPGVCFPVSLGSVGFHFAKLVLVAGDMSPVSTLSS